MKYPAKAAHSGSSRRRNFETKPIDKDLEQLALALESAKAMKLAPPEPQDPQRDPAMWSRLFGMWS